MVPMRTLEPFTEKNFTIAVCSKISETISDAGQRFRGRTNGSLVPIGAAKFVKAIQNLKNDQDYLSNRRLR